MKDFEEIDDNINELLLQKRFNDLTDEEKNKVLIHAANETEYNQLRDTLLAITTSFTAEEDNFSTGDVKNDLMAQFEKKFGANTTKTPVVPLYRKPFFQLAVAASIALFLFLAIPLLNDQPSANKDLALNQPTKTTESAPAEKAIDPSVGVDGLNESKAVDAENKTTTIVAEEEKPTAKTVNDEISKSENGVPVLEMEKANEVVVADKELARSLSKSENNETKNHPLKPTVIHESAKDQNQDVLYADDYSSYNKITNEKLKKKSESERKEESRFDSNAKPSANSDNSMTDMVTGAISNAPGTNSALVQTEKFVEKNTGEMIDLLFTAF